MALVPVNDLQRLKDGARRFASGFTPGQKAVTIAAIIGAILIGVVFMSFSGKPSYAVLFSGLRAQDAASITQQLQTDHVPYELEGGGSTILVPANDVAQARLTAAAAGLPSQSTVGLTLLDKAGLTTSQLTQQADYLQAIQGELEQTIDGISGVTSSQVNVAEAANQTFALGGTAPSGASVLVTMNPGQTLPQSEVEAIVHLVASSVPGLNPDKVTVADSNGTLLAGPGISGSAAQNSQTSSYDASVASKVQAYLASVFGPGNADVQVNATLNFNKVHTSTHQLVPNVAGAPASFCTSTKKTSTTYKGSGTPPGGNAGTIVAPTAGGGAGTYTQTQTSQSCETGTQSQTVTQATGSVVKQSVAVLVNAHSVAKGTTIGAIRNGVAAAANLQPSRGDVLSFAVAPFSTAASQQAAAAAKAAAAAGKRSQMGNMIKDGAALLAVLLLLFLIWRSSKKKPRVATAIPAQAMEPELASAYSAPYIEPAPTGEIPRVRSGPPLTERVSVEIEQFIDEQPAEVASVLRSWLRQDATALEHAGSER